MRILLGLVAVLALSAAHAQDISSTTIPEGGLQLVAPGFTLQAPVAGWSLVTLDLKTHIKKGALRGNFARGPWQLFHGERRINDGFILIDLVRWQNFPANVDRYVRELDSGEPIAGKNGGEYFSKTVNGAHCAGLKKTDDGQGRARVWRVCAHPEHPGFAISFLYEAENSKVESEAVAVLDSLRFKPLPYNVRELRLGCTVQDIAEAKASLWISCNYVAGGYPEKGFVFRIDPSKSAVAASIPVGGNAGNIAVSPDALWVADLDGDALTRIDPRTNSVTGRVKLPGLPLNVVFSGGALWVNYSDDHKWGYVRVDPVTLAVGEPILLEVPAVEIATERAIFFLQVRSDRLMRLDAGTGEITAHANLGDATQLLRYDGRYLWMTGLEEGTPVILRFDPQTPDIPPVVTKRLPAFAHDAVEWNNELCVIANQSVQCFAGGDTSRLPHEVPLEAYLPADLHVFAGSLWVEDSGSHAVVRIDPK